MSEQPLYIAVGGPIGLGRSLLTRYLAEELGAHAQYELVDANPFLEDFYTDPAGYAFPSQLAFLARAFVQVCDLMTSEIPVVQDRLMGEHFHVYTRQLHLDGHLDDEQFAELERIFHSYVSVVRRPDLLVYLRAGVPALVERIAERNRFAEQLDSAYLERLDVRYQEWIADYRSKNVSPVLELDANELDIREPGPRATAIAAVKAELARLRP